MQIAGAGVLGFVSAWFFFKRQQSNAGCPRANVSGIPQLGPFKEYSVIYTDRAYNLLSPPFQECMRDIDRILKSAYNAEKTVLIPGSGTYAMEAVARQFGTDQTVLIVRNGYFSYRWSDIFEVTKIAKEEIVLKAQPSEDGNNPSFEPHPIEDVIAVIQAKQPAAVFAPHVETSTGMIISESYIKQITDAVHAYGGVFVLDCVASGNAWIDMKRTGVDVVISAPQKGWTGPACVGIAMLSAHAVQKVETMELSSNSFVANLKQWMSVMDAYTAGGAKYYTTLPTDSLMRFRDVLLETEEYGLEKSRQNIFELGDRIRDVLEQNGFKSVAANHVKAPGVVVSYSPFEGMGGKFKDEGMQIAGGVPFKLDEDTKYGVNARKQCFRIGLFGLDKLQNIDTCVSQFELALKNIIKKEDKSAKL